MAKKYVYIDGVKYEVVNNYILGLDVYSDGSIPRPTASDDGKVITVDENGNYVLDELPEPEGFIEAPSAPSDGDFLVYSSASSAWVAKSLSAWTAGSY